MAKLCYLVRGHGFGHAARDLRVINALRRRRPEMELVIGSAGSGVEYLRSRGERPIDLGYADEVDHEVEATWSNWRFLHENADADIFVVDEIMRAPDFCARILRRPCVLMTDWFFAEVGRSTWDSLLDLAAEVIVPDFAEAHPIALATSAPVWFAKPITEQFGIDRQSAREAVLPGHADGRVVVVALGGRPDRRAAREIQLFVLEMWEQYAGPEDQLLLLAEAPGALGKISSTARVQWRGRVPSPEVYYAAADVVVADSLGFTPCELIANRVPTIAVLHPDRGRTVRPGLNGRLRTLEKSGLLSSVTLEADPADIWNMIEKLHSAERAEVTVDWATPESVADRILRHL